MKAELALLIFVGCFLSQSTSFLVARDFFYRSSSSSSSLSAKKAAEAQTAPNSATTTPPTHDAFQKLLAKKEGPDFYTKFRLNRLIKRYKDALPFDQKNYPDSTTDHELYEAYTLDLLLKGKIKFDEFDIGTENLVSEEEWGEVFSEIADWTDSVDTPISEEVIPESPFDLLEAFYPELKKNFQELEGPLGDANVPFRTKRELMEAAFKGKFSAQEYEKELDAEALEKELDAIEEKAIQRVDAYTKKMIAQIESSSPSLDKDALAFYQEAKSIVSGAPVTRAQWEADRKKTDQLVEEMAALAAQGAEEEHHHGGHHDDGHHSETLSVPEQFKQKYNRDLKKIQERLSKYNSNPVNYIENIVQEVSGGPQGLDWWKEIEKTYEENYAKLNDAERETLVQKYRTFLNTLPK